MKPSLLFISPRNLLPIDSGGKIRTTQILRGMKGGHFNITLALPVPKADRLRLSVELSEFCDRLVTWDETERGASFKWSRLRYVFSDLPIPVASDISRAGRDAVGSEMRNGHAVVVFDFPHACVLGTPPGRIPSVLFTHNVESEIFDRHSTVASNWATRWLWRGQQRKMAAFEGWALCQFTRVVAVSERDAEMLQQLANGSPAIDTIPTGVDLDFFNYVGPSDSPRVVFSGSMDWMANIDAIEFFMDEIWPKVVAEIPDASMTVAGRAPPDALVDTARRRGLNWEFTGYVDDIRVPVRQASVYVIPLRVGGGTRLKVFEAMAMGCPVVSTAIGVEGLDISDGQHFLKADDPKGFANAICRLMRDGALGHRLAANARELMDARYSYTVASQRFEEICLAAVEDLARGRGPQ